MKALVDRLEWVRLYLTDPKIEIPKELVIDELLAAIAIAEALPEITISIPDQPVDQRAPPERIIKLPDT